MKYRVKYTDTSWLWLTPFAFAFFNLGGSNYWEVQSKKHWWNKWKRVGYLYDNPEEAYIEYFKLAYNIDIQKRRLFSHNKYKDQNIWCKLKIGHFKGKSKDYNEGKHYYAGYKPNNYAKFYYCSYGKSYEEALNKLYWDLYIKDLINK